MSYNVKVVDTEQKLQHKILVALTTEINKRLKMRIPSMENQIRDIIRLAIRESDEYESLEWGALAFEFGVEKGDGYQKMEDLIRLWADSVHTTFSPARVVQDKIVGSLVIEAIRGDYIDAYMTDAAHISGKHGELPWLEWLLERGGENIVEGHKIQYGFYPSPDPSRSGSAIMVPGGSWSIPAPFNYGSINDNFITRAIRDKQEDIREVLIHGLS